MDQIAQVLWFDINFDEMKLYSLNKQNELCD